MELFPTRRIFYSALNARQKENYNFQKVSSVLADYGFSTIRLTDDWNGADFIAQHADGKTILRIQLKGRLYFSKRYKGKRLWICFRDNQDMYLVLHDRALRTVIAKTTMSQTKSWKEKGGYSYPKIPKKLLPFFEQYKIMA